MKRQSAWKVTYTKRHLDIRLTHPQAEIFDMVLFEFLQQFQSSKAWAKEVALVKEIQTQMQSSLTKIKTEKAGAK